MPAPFVVSTESELMADQPDLGAFMDFLDEDGFTTPKIKSPTHPEGKVYLVPSPDGATGAKLSALSTLAIKANAKVEVSQTDIARLKLDDGEERDVYQQALGPAYDEMISDGVSWQRISRLGQYAYVYFTSGPQQANEAAAAGVFSGKAPALNRSQRRATGRSAGKAQPAPRASTASRSRSKAPGSTGS